MKACPVCGTALETAPFKWRSNTAMPAPTPALTLPLVVDIRDWPEVRARLKLQVVKRSWPAGQPRPVLDVIISAEMEAEGGANTHPLLGNDRPISRGEGSKD